MEADRTLVIIDLPSALPDALHRAGLMALEVLAAAGISPERAQRAVDARDEWNARGSNVSVPCDDELEAAAAFDLARLAAFDVCTGGERVLSEAERFVFRFRVASALN